LDCIRVVDAGARIDPLAGRLKNQTEARWLAAQFNKGYRLQALFYLALANA